MSRQSYQYNRILSHHLLRTLLWLSLQSRTVDTTLEGKEYSMPMHLNILTRYLLLLPYRAIVLPSRRGVSFIRSSIHQLPFGNAFMILSLSLLYCALKKYIGMVEVVSIQATLILISHITYRVETKRTYR